MIKEIDVREAIAEMQGQKNPNAQTCIKLAAYYTILDHLAESRPVETMYSGSDQSAVIIDSDSEFAAKIAGRKQADIWPVIDELMSTIQVINPRLYEAVIVKLGA